MRDSELADLNPKGDTSLETERRPPPPEDKSGGKTDSMEHFQRQWPTTSERDEEQQQSDFRVLSQTPPEKEKGKA